jgi:hypothetical protein
VRRTEISKVVEIEKMFRTWYSKRCLKHLRKSQSVLLTHLFNNCLRLSHFPKPWKEAKIITLPDPEVPQHLRPIDLLSTTAKIFEIVSLKIVQRHIEERGLLNASQFGFRARHSTTHEYMRLTRHIAINFKNRMSTADAFLDIDKAYHKTGHLVLIYKSSKLKFSINVIKLIGFFFS